MRIFARLMPLLVICISSFIMSAQQDLVAKKILSNVREITAIKQPCRVGFFYNNNLMVANHMNAYVVDPQQNKIIREMNFSDRCPLTCMLDNKRERIVVADLKNAGLYDKKGRVIYKPVSSTADASYVFAASGILYTMHLQDKQEKQLPLVENTRNGLQYELPETVNWSPYAIIAAHPFEEKIFCTSHSVVEGQWLNEITIKKTGLKIDTQRLAKPHSSFTIIHAHQHSPTCGIMAFYYPDVPGWKLYNRLTQKFITKKPLSGHLLAFHPYIPSLLALLDKDGLLSLYDIDKNMITATTQEPLDTPELIASLNEQLIDFSRDGNHIAVIVNDRCFVIDLDWNDAN